MTFKRSRLNPFQNYRSITSFSVDWPRTIRLVYASVSILSVCAIMLQVIVIQTRWNTKRLTKEFYKQKSRGSSCERRRFLHQRLVNSWFEEPFSLHSLTSFPVSLFLPSLPARKDRKIKDLGKRDCAVSHSSS